jgi:hypothetical protein
MCFFMVFTTPLAAFCVILATMGEPSATIGRPPLDWYNATVNPVFAVTVIGALTVAAVDDTSHRQHHHHQPHPSVVPPTAVVPSPMEAVAAAPSHPRAIADLLARLAQNPPTPTF